MRATVIHGERDVRVEEVPDPVLLAGGSGRDAVVRVVATAAAGPQHRVRDLLDADVPLAVDDRRAHRAPRGGAGVPRGRGAGCAGDGRRPV